MTPIFAIGVSLAHPLMPSPNKSGIQSGCFELITVVSLALRRRFLKVPMLVNNLGLLEQLAYWKVSSPCSAAGYHLAMKKHRCKPTHLTTLSENYKVITLLRLQFLNLLFRKVWVTFSNRLDQTSKLIAGLCHNHAPARPTPHASLLRFPAQGSSPLTGF